MEFYNNGGIVVRNSRLSDIEAMKDRLRHSDVKEIWASHHKSPEEALMDCVNKTILSLTIENGKPLGIFGINAPNVLGNKAIVFMLATDDLYKIKKRFVQRSREFVDMMLCFYGYLENYVHTENKKSIAWLVFLGAVIEKPKPYGVDGELFHHFYFQRRN